MISAPSPSITPLRHRPCNHALARCQVQSVDGFAMLSVLLIMVLLSITTVPLVQMVARNKKLVQEHQIQALLYQEAKENLEIGTYLIKLQGGIPMNDYTMNSVSLPGNVEQIARRCERRIRAVDDEFLGMISLSATMPPAPPVWHSSTATSNNREVVIFMAFNNQSDAYEKYIVVACASSQNDGLGVFASELISVDGGFFTLSHGQF